MNIKRSTFSTGSGLKRPIPLFVLLTLFSCLVAVITAYFKDNGNFNLAFGDTLIIEALVMFGIAWVGHLKKDGIRFFPPGKSVNAKAAESWKDRVPSLGKAPHPMPSIPGADGPDAADYKRLIVAEDQLRKKILGIGTNGTKTIEDTAKGTGFIKSAVFSGFILLILALCFEYLVPRLPR